MYPMYFDVRYLLFSLPALLLALWAQWRVQSSFRKFSQYRLWSGLSGAQVARRVLDANDLHDVQVERVSGFLSDHYDPRAKVLRLSPAVYDSNSIAAAGVAAHEAGHAVQDREGYLALQARSAMVPTVQIGSWLGPIVFMIGLFTVPLFGLTAVFAVITLPVEFDASRRARQALANLGLVSQEEMRGVNNVLGAAALTYVAGAAQAISTLLYYAMLLSGIRSRD